MLKFKDGKFKDIVFEVYDAQGDLYQMKGACTINDNGYLSWSCMMEPSKVSCSEAEKQWSEMVESLRKDVECFFGILKQMFGILKYGSRFQSQELMDDIFLTCCALYNQRFELAGNDECWDEMWPADDNSDDSEIDSDSLPSIFNRLRTEFVRDSEDFRMSGIGAGDNLHVPDPPSHAEVLTHDRKKAALITHFQFALSKHEVIWPRQGRTSHVYHPSTV
jgi:hypothetical protein